MQTNWPVFCKFSHLKKIFLPDLVSASSFVSTGVSTINGRIRRSAASTKEKRWWRSMLVLFNLNRIFYRRKLQLSTSFILNSWSNSAVAGGSRCDRYQCLSLSPFISCLYLDPLSIGQLSVDRLIDWLALYCVVLPGNWSINRSIDWLVDLDIFWFGEPFVPTFQFSAVFFFFF